MKTYPDSILDCRCRSYLPVRRVVAGEGAEGVATLIGSSERQSFYNGVSKNCILKPGGWLILDFGIELNGGIRLIAAPCDGGISIRIRFGESVSETCGQPSNDHAIHDGIYPVAGMGITEIGNTGFRFVRIDLPENAGKALSLIGIQAVALYRDFEYAGSFKCNDERLNRIWQTAAYTVHLNMQDYIYDGIKRDRLVWMGDLHPEIKVILSVFDDRKVVPDSLDFLRDRTPLPLFMNNISSYSCWWVIAQYDWYWYRGDLTYLRQQKDYLLVLLKQLSGYIGMDGSEQLPGMRFLDWPSQASPEATHAGLQGLMFWAMNCGEKICRFLGEDTTATECIKAQSVLRRHYPDAAGYKQAAAMQTVSGLADAAKINRDVLSVNPLDGLSTFLGYYTLQARAMAGDYSGALEVIRRYWGAMLDFGATTFWEDFDLRWTENAFRIDELPVPGKKDIHADFGNYCYKGLRHSLCHGWSGGPAAWMSENLLGIKILEPGAKTVEIKPNLVDLDWLEGSFPTPYGPIKVMAEKGKKPKVIKPQDITILS
jgi:hypothetical protein